MDHRGRAGAGLGARRIRCSVHARTAATCRDAFEADAVAVAIWKLITTNTDTTDGFEGTATELLEAISNSVTDGIRKSKYWPQSPAQLGNRVMRAAPLLKAKGCAVERRHSGARVITIKPPPAF